VEPGRRPTRSAIDSLGAGTTVMVFGTFALLLLNFVARVYTARHLTPAQFGDFNLGLALAGLLALVALVGLHQAMARTIAENRDPALSRRIVRWAAIVTAVTSVVSSSLVFFFAGSIASLFDPAESVQLTLVFQLFSVTVGLTLLCTFLASIFQGFEDTVPNAWLNQAVQPAAFLVFVVVFFSLHLDFEGALLAWVVSNGVTFGALVAYTLLHLPKHLPPGPSSAELPKGLLSLSLALWGVTTLTFVTAFVDTLILGAFRPSGQVGVYSAVMTLARLILVVSAAVTYIFLPVAARLSGQGDTKTLREMFATVTRWIVIFTLPIFFVFALLPSDSITTVFGPEYVSGASALVLITAGALVSVTFGPVNAALAGMGITRPLLISTALSAGANVGLSFALIPTYGLMGAAVAWTVARVLYPATAAVSLYFAQHIQPFRRSFLLPLGASFVLGSLLFLAIALFPHPSWLVFPLYFAGLGLCLAMVLATRSVEEGDLVACRIVERVLGRPLPGLRKTLERSLSIAGGEGDEGVHAA
jgi:O-antigen/teichoic acid export membrane protein